MLRCEWQQQLSIVSSLMPTFGILVDTGGVENSGAVLLASELQDLLTDPPDGEVLRLLRPVLVLGMGSPLGTLQQEPQVLWVQLDFLNLRRHATSLSIFMSRILWV